MGWSGRRIAVRVGAGTGVLAAALLAGCGDDTPRRAPATQVSRGPVQPAPAQTGPLPDVQIEHSPLTLAAPLAAGTLIDARVLVIAGMGPIPSSARSSRRSVTWGRRSTCSSPPSGRRWRRRI